MRMLILPFVSVALAGAAPVDEKDPVATLTAAERALAATAVREGFNPALLRFVAEDGIIFRPDPVKGKSWLLSGEPMPATLDWWPEYVETSCDGKLGWSTGPVIRDGGPARSHYVTIWRREEDGLWRFVFDQGSPHATQAETFSRDAQPQTRDRSFCNLRDSAGRNQAETSLFAADAALSAAQRADTIGAFRKALAPAVRIHRWGVPPITDRDQALALLAKEPPLTPGKRLGGEAAASGDLGFTYGDIAWEEPGRGTQKGYYFRVWRRTGDQWQLAFDQIRPLTPPPPPPQPTAPTQKN